MEVSQNIPYYVTYYVTLAYNRISTIIYLKTPDLEYIFWNTWSWSIFIDTSSTRECPLRVYHLKITPPFLATSFGDDGNFFLPNVNLSISLKTFGSQSWGYETGIGLFFKNEIKSVKFVKCGLRCLKSCQLSGQWPLDWQLYGWFVLNSAYFCSPGRARITCFQYWRKERKSNRNLNHWNYTFQGCVLMRQ